MPGIHQGDSYPVYLSYLVNDEPLKNEYAEMEFSINAMDQNGVTNTFLFYLSKQEIMWDEIEEKFYIRLTQDQTFLFDRNIKYQLRLQLPNGDVYGDDGNCQPIGKTLSKKVLDGSYV